MQEVWLTVYSLLKIRSFHIDVGLWLSFLRFFLFLRSFSFLKKSYPHLFTPVIDLHHSEISYTVQCDFILSEALAYAHVDWDIGASPGCYVVPCCNYRILSGVACQRKASACCLTGRLSVPSFFLSLLRYAASVRFGHSIRRSIHWFHCSLRAGEPEISHQQLQTTRKR